MYRPFTQSRFLSGTQHVTDMAELGAVSVFHYLPLLPAVNAQRKGHVSLP